MIQFTDNEDTDQHCALNPFMLNGISRLYQLDKSIYNFRVVG